LSLGWLKREILEVVPGQKVAYVTDCAYTDANVATIINLAQGADILVIEATFLHAEAERARARSHLTAWQAGDLGRRAGVGRIVPGHFSAKYRGREEELLAEVEQGFHGKG
jgi:ribonuclease Z